MTDIVKAARIIREAEALLIVAGAGMGVDSGLPDYRGINGLYNDYPPFAKLGVNYMEMTRPSGLESNPRLAWGFWGYQLALFRTKQPHLGYSLLLEIAKIKADNYFVQTTNVDGHFQKAGFPPDRIHECHGSLHRLQCFYPCHDEVWSSDSLKVEINPVTMELESPLPACPECGFSARPNVFMFGDSKYIWDAPRGHVDRYQAWLAENRDRKLAIIECGAGTVSPGLRRHSQELAKEYPNTWLIRINPHEPETPQAGNCFSIPLGALEGIKQIQGFLVSG